MLLPATHATAIGFGDIVLHSRIGEPLRADVPIIAEPGEGVESACFSLAALNGSDLPVVTSAKTRLVRDGDRFRLQITGSKPIGEPLFLIGLRAGCGVDLQRDYVLMPAEPVVFAAPATPAPASADAPVGEPGTARGRAGAMQEWRASEGETLENISEALVPNNLVQQRRMLAALKRANPNLAGRPAIAEGTTVLVPDLRQRIAAERDSLPAQKGIAPEREAAPSPPRVREAPKPRPPKQAAAKASKPKASGPDRVMLGAPPADLKPGERAAPPKGSRAEMNERMQQLEATIQSLNAQIEALDKALELTSESLALQKKLQAAQAGKPADAGGVAAPVIKPPEARVESNAKWLEIIASALGGGLVVALVALLLGRRRERRAESEVPLGVAPPATPVRPNAPPVAQPVTVNVPLETFSQGAGDVSAVDVSFSHDESALALAEIMLSFGRLQAAAETLAVHVEEHSPDNPRPWLMLLDLYRRGAMRAEYARLVPRLRQKFNLQAPSWEEGAASGGLRSLEDYPHVVAQLTAIWGTRTGRDYLHRLLHDNRAGQRTGFPLEVVEEILLLQHVADAAWPGTQTA